MTNINKGLLHRAFSAFVFRPSDGKLLLQQRASEKITFPDMWTNTCCSHPLDDFEEEKEEREQRGVRVAASRKLEHELGIPQAQTPVDAFQYLTRIHYLAPSDGIWGEHEGAQAGPCGSTRSWTRLLIHVSSSVDYILFFTGDVDVTPNANEIRDYKYVDKAELQAMFDAPGFAPSFLPHIPNTPLTVMQATRSRRGSSSLPETSCLAGGTSSSPVGMGRAWSRLRACAASWTDRR